MVYVIASYPNLTELWHTSMRRMWRGELGGDIDFVASIDTIAYDNVLAARSMDFDFDLGRDLWLNKQRWTRLVRQYLDREEVIRFIAHAQQIYEKEGRRGVVTNMFCTNVAREAKKHRWGNCMMAFTYRGHYRGKPTLTLHSRVSYIAYIGGADLALAHVLAREIMQPYDIGPSEVRFRWHVDALQFHGFKSLPLLYRREYIEDLEDEDLRFDHPTIKIVGKWWDKITMDERAGKPLEDEPYGPLRRVRRRFREYQAGEFLPSVTCDQLTLAPLFRR